MTSIRGCLVLALAACAPLAVGLGGCAPGEVVTTGTSTVTVEVVDLVGAQGSQLEAELAKNVDYGQTAPTWPLLSTAVTSSPFTFSDTVGSLPEGEFGLSVHAGADGKSQTAVVKGQGCEMTLLVGKDENVTISIDGLNAFGDKGYGDCRATVTR
jgi:hypothetical protein